MFENYPVENTNLRNIRWMKATFTMDALFSSQYSKSLLRACLKILLSIALENNDYGLNVHFSQEYVILA